MSDRAPSEVHEGACTCMLHVSSQVHVHIGLAVHMGLSLRNGICWRNSIHVCEGSHTMCMSRSLSPGRVHTKVSMHILCPEISITTEERALSFVGISVHMN